MKGEVWLYHDDDANKTRPMVIVGERNTAVELDISFCKMTSQKPKDEYDVIIDQWKESGLAKPSVVRCSKIMTISKNRLIGKVAQLTEPELKKVLDTIVKYILS
jgi:mRNA interferase MazF